MESMLVRMRRGGGQEFLFCGDSRVCEQVKEAMSKFCPVEYLKVLTYDEALCNSKDKIHLTVDFEKGTIYCVAFKKRTALLFDSEYKIRYKDNQYLLFVGEQYHMIQEKFDKIVEDYKSKPYEIPFSEITIGHDFVYGFLVYTKRDERYGYCIQKPEHSDNFWTDKLVTPLSKTDLKKVKS